MKKYLITSILIIFNYPLLAKEFIITPTKVNPGDFIIITTSAKNFTNLTATSSLTHNISFPFYFTSEGSISIIPVPIETKKRIALIQILENNKIIQEIKVKINLTKKEKTQKPRRLNLTKESSEILNQKEIIEEDIKYIFSKIKSISLHYFQNYSSPSLSLPSNNKITSPFGKLRIYSNGVKRYHKGVDFSYTPDPNVYSVGNGIVIISRNFLASGESVYLYHGYGIISSYFHLEERYVKEGDYIKKGQIIGKIGKTGIVTGPHLHSGLYIVGRNGYIPINLISYISKSENLIKIAYKKLNKNYLN